MKTKNLSFSKKRAFFSLLLCIGVLLMLTSCESTAECESVITIHYPIKGEQIFEVELIKNGEFIKSAVMPEEYYSYFFNESHAYGSEEKIAVLLAENEEYFIVYSND